MSWSASCAACKSWARACPSPSPPRAVLFQRRSSPSRARGRGTRYVGRRSLRERESEAHPSPRAQGGGVLYTLGERSRSIRKAFLSLISLTLPLLVRIARIVGRLEYGRSTRVSRTHGCRRDGPGRECRQAAWRYVLCGREWDFGAKRPRQAARRWVYCDCGGETAGKGFHEGCKDRQEGSLGGELTLSLGGEGSDADACYICFAEHEHLCPRGAHAPRRDARKRHCGSRKGKAVKHTRVGTCNARWVLAGQSKCVW